MSPIPPSEINVLVVDDENTLRSTCRAFLEGFGYNVVAVERADEAVALLKRRSFHILLLDLYMPQMSGLDLLKEALALPDAVKTSLKAMTPASYIGNAARQAREI